MEFRIADTFTKSLANLNAQEQRAAKTSAFDLQLDPARQGLHFHRIDRSKDANFWSIRVNADIRIIVHKTAASFLLCYVGHHDDAYGWAERRRIEAHPRTGAIQIVEVRERVEEIAPALPFAEPEAAQAQRPVFIFTKLTDDDLARIGVPTDWVADVRQATEDRYFEIAGHLPAEAAEALLEYAATGRLGRAISAPPMMEMRAEFSLPDMPDTIFERAILSEPHERLTRREPDLPSEAFEHPDAQRRIRTIENAEDLARALDFPWEQWSVFLHPSQGVVVAADYSGPARVTGSAGTGKTVVALHRAARLARDLPEARILLTTFSQPLANMLQRKLDVLIGKDASIVPRVTVTPWRGVAEELYQLAFGRKPHIASDDLVRATLLKAAEGQGAGEFTERFLASEWTNVVDAWQIGSAEEYANVPRLGRKNRMGPKQRARLWPVFAATREALAKRVALTWARVFAEVTAWHGARAAKPFTHLVVDEAQDLGVPELRMLAAIAPAGENALFFAGDLGQRILQQPFSWKALGVDVRGRSQVLKVNYRTSHQIRRAADRLLPKVVRDVDGLESERFGTVSVFNGPEPEVTLHATVDDEIAAVAKWIGETVAAGIQPSEIGLFVRTVAELPRARAAVHASGHQVSELYEHDNDGATGVSVGIMHLGKGLEFKAVAILACDDEVVPLQERIAAVADEAELDDVYQTERHLLYVASTRARDRLRISGIAPASEFLKDIQA